MILWKAEFVRVDWRHLLSFGLGWGFLEAFLMYVLSVWAAVFFLGFELGFMDLLAGAVERNLAVVLHVSLTFIVFRALARRVFLLVALALHAAVDFVAVAALRLLGLGVWSVEGVVAVQALIVAMISCVVAGRGSVGKF